MAEDRIEFAKLPLVADIPVTDTRRRIMSLMEELDDVTEQKALLSVREDAAKDALERLQRETEKTGFRHGNLAFCSQPVKGRKTLDKMLLLENGCPAAILNKSYRVGEPTIRNTFKRLGENDDDVT